jgi:hypothetical protein
MFLFLLRQFGIIDPSSNLQGLMKRYLAYEMTTISGFIADEFNLGYLICFSYFL